MTPPIAAEDDAARVQSLIEQCPIGGVVLFNGTWPHAARTLAALQAHSPHPLLVGTDMERGVGQQVAGATEFPHARAFAAVEDAGEAVRTSARMAAREARACGIHWAFAPVADVNLNPANPIIGTRAFSEEPATTEGLVKAFIRGARAEGLLTTAKHFPGHGRTDTDSHATLPVVSASREALMAVDGAPFRAAIEAGVDSVMTAHVAYPALDPVRRPATNSPPILQDLLRDAMGFGGVVISDSLRMEGAASDAEPGTRAATLIQSGVDVLLDPADPRAVVEGLVRAVNQGRLAEVRLQEAFERVWRLKTQWAERFGPDGFAPSAAADDPVVGAPAHQAHAEQVARRGVTVWGSAAEPPSIDRMQRVLVIRMVRSVPEDTSPLEEAARLAWPRGDYEDAPADLSRERMEQIEVQARRADQVLIAVTSTPAAWQSAGLSAAQTMLLRTIVSDHPATVAALGGPQVLDVVPAEARSLLCTFSDAPVAQQALVWYLTKTDAR